MKVHHLNCGTMCPLGAKLLPGVFPQTIVSHCLLIEDQQRLILIDTGLGMKDVEDKQLLGLTGWALSPVLDPAHTAFNQIKKLGYSPGDVTDIIPTHLDLDHAGGIQDFPQARVHVAQAELQNAKKRRGFFAKQRYRAHQIPENAKWVTYDYNGEPWQGFSSVKRIEALPTEILLVSLPGHTEGHTGILIESKSGPLLHAGDSYYHHNELTHSGKTPLGLQLFQRFIHSDYKSAMRTQEQLTQLHQRSDIKIFCSHDPFEFESAQKQISRLR